MIVLIPTYSGIGPVDHWFVPLATPEAPVEFSHVTLATPTLSLAVPVTVIEVAEVATVVIVGNRIVIDGGTVSDPAPGVAGGVEGGVAGCGGSAGGLGACSVTVTLAFALSLLASIAVTVMRFEPTCKGTAAMLQLTPPNAAPAAP